MPSRDVAADVEQLTAVLGAELVFAIEVFGARVAMLWLSAGPPPTSCWRTFCNPASAGPMHSAPEPQITA